MKKISRLLILLTALTLTGCNTSGGGSKPKKSSSYSSSVSSSSGESSSTSGAPSSSATSATSSSSSTSGSSITSIPSGTVFIINLSGNDIDFYDYGMHIDSESDPNNVKKLKDAINNQAGADFVSDISASSMQVGSDNGEHQAAHYHLQVGSASAAGSITFNFVAYVSKVVISCYPYFKNYSGGSNVDTNARINIEGETHNLTTKTEGDQELQTFEYTYSTVKKSLSLSNNAGQQRVFIETIEFHF